ncbi:MAG TPA: hypothetical protein DD643_02305 [Synechococcus sp. UBA8638]|nr:hypothetical protein [Synechococcus sp. UBA8638]
MSERDPGGRDQHQPVAHGHRAVAGPAQAWANHDPSLDELRHQRSVFFARRPQAWGILEGMDHYRFFSR